MTSIDKENITNNFYHINPTFRQTDSATCFINIFFFSSFNQYEALIAKNRYKLISIVPIRICLK